MGTTVRRLAAALSLAACLAPAPLPEAAAQDAPRKVALDAYLKGAVVRFDGTRVEVHYDLSDEAQLLDFSDWHPFVLAGSWRRNWVDRTVHLEGTGGIVWKPILRRRAEMEMDVRFKLARDFGAYAAEERLSDHFAVFSVFDQFFQNKDRKGSPKQHMICRFLPDAHDSGGDRAFRYVIRNPGPAVEPQRPFRFKFGSEGEDDWMEIDGTAIKGTDKWGPPLRGLRLGLYVIENEAWVGNLVLRGELDPKWAEQAGVDLALPVKPHNAKPGTRTPNDADIAAQQKVQAVRNGADGPGSLVPLLANADLLESVREEAAKALEEMGDLKLVPRLVTPMESQDLLTRKLAARVVQKLSGKSFGYSAEAPEESRRRAVRSLLDWIEKNPAKFK